MIGQTLNNRYKITDRLGKGAMGTVYRAVDTQNNRDVALKVISSELIIESDMLERFKREGEALSRLKHPNIVEFLDAFEYQENYVIVMEYIAGGSLHELIKKGALSIERASYIALGLCDALIRSHNLGMIHRDLKPENVLIAEDGTPKLADFGVARLNEGTRITRSGTQVGTPYYMAPEAWEGKALDAQADIWSLGVVLFEMLTGKVPFGGDTGAAVMNKVLTTNPPNLKTLRNESPSGMVRIVSRMLTRDKKRRYQSMREIAVDLERSQQSSGTEKKSSVKPQTLRIIYAIPLVIGVIFLYRWFQPLPAQTLDHPDVTNDGVIHETSTPKATTPPTITSVPKLGIDSKLQAEDGATLIYIPDGEFIMGSENGEADELPVRTVTLDSFWLDETEVTNGMYENCVNAGVCAPPFNRSSSTNASYYGNEDLKDYPVLFVNWEMANNYCTWANRRLPTEAEWEKAARGEDERKYPWGDSFDGERLNTCDINCQMSWANFSFDDGYADVAPVGSYPTGKSPYGALDMLGNVWEWVDDWYDRYDQNPVASNPTGSDSGTYKILRGGGWDLDGIFRASDRFRAERTETGNNIGFRCARDAEESDLALFLTQIAPTSSTGIQPTAAPVCISGSNVNTETISKAEAFSQPILESLAGVAPTFQDDFSTTGNGWKETRVAGAWEAGTMEVVDGVLRFSDVKGQNLTDTGTWSYAQDFVFEIDQNIADGFQSTEQRITFHIFPAGANDYGTFSLQIYQKGGFWTFRKSRSSAVEDIAEGTCGLNLAPESNRFTFVVRQDKFTLLINGIAVYYLQDPDLVEPGWMHLLCSSPAAAVCEWDNVKFWSLD